MLSAATDNRVEAMTRFTRNVAHGLHRLQHAYVNCYVLESGAAGDRGVTIIDTAFPNTWPLMVRALSAIERSPSDVRAILLTHAHFDHLGFARRAQLEWGAPVFAHSEESYLARHPYRYEHERSRLTYPLRHPGSIPVLGRMVGAGALRVLGLDDLQSFGGDDVLSVPGNPRVVFSPGHTFGHCAFHLAEQSVVLTGDALVTFDPYTGARGPQIVSGAATANSDDAMASLDALEQTEARIVLPGHGQPWRSGIAAAAEAARSAGRS